MSKFVPSSTALHAGSEDSSAEARPPTRRYENFGVVREVVMEVVGP